MVTQATPTGIGIVQNGPGQQGATCDRDRPVGEWAGTTHLLDDILRGSFVAMVR